MAISMNGFYPTQHFRPQIDIINPRHAANLVKIIEHQSSEDDPVTIDFANVKSLTNLAARILCKRFYGRELIIENANEAVQSSLDWAADYLYRKGELDSLSLQEYDYPL